jgi:hypothetical protein
MCSTADLKQYLGSFRRFGRHGSQLECEEMEFREQDSC